MYSHTRRHRGIQSSLHRLLSWIVKIIALFGLASVILSAILWVLWLKVDLRSHDHLNVVWYRPEMPTSMLILYDLTAGQYNLIEIDNQLLVPVTHGFGQYRVGVLGALGKQEGLGFELVRTSLSWFTGIDIQGVIVHNKNDFYGKLESLQVYSSFNPLERLWLADLFQTKLRYNQTDQLNSHLNQISSKLTLSRRESHLAGQVNYNHIGQSDLQIRIINTTGQSGLAGFVGVTLRGLGYDVVSLGQSQADLTVSRIYVETASLVDDNYIRPLTDLLVVSEPIRTKPVLEEHRADIVIYLGRDTLELIGAVMDYFK